MDRKPYTVENQRPRQVVTLCGSVLAPKGRGRTSLKDLTEEEFLSEACQKLLACGRLAVLRGPNLIPAAAAPAVSEETAVTEVAAVEQQGPASGVTASAVTPEATSTKPPAPEAESTTPKFDELVTAAEGTLPEAGLLVATSELVEPDKDLAEMGYRELQAECRARGLASSGSAEELRARLAAKEGE